MMNIFQTFISIYITINVDYQFIKIMSGDKKSSSLSTVLAMYNNMLGGALLSFPILFKTKGIISSVIVMIVSAIISFLTCRIYVLHSKTQEKDIEQSIVRILGQKWKVYFSLISGIYLVLLNIISIDLIVDQLYGIIFFFFDNNGSKDTIAPKDSLQFGRFSTQWLTLILFIPLLALCSIKNFNLMVKLSEYGSGAAFVYIIYVIIQFFVSVIGGTIDMSQIQWFSFDVAEQAGSASLAFTIHTVVNAFTHQNEHEEKNERDLGITYIMGLATYLIVSLAGSFAISDKHCTNTIIDCYLSDWTILFVQVTYLMGRICALPIMIQISRLRLIQIFYGEVTAKKVRIFNILFMVLGTIISILSPKLPLSTLITIVGSVVCFFFIYYFPIKLHLTCLHSPARVKKEDESLIDESTMLEEQEGSVPCYHSADYYKKHSKFFRQILYMSLNVIGVVVAGAGLFFSIKKTIDS